MTLPDYDRWKTAGPPEDEVCPDCDGEGSLPGRDEWGDHCLKCMGTGRVPLDETDEEPDDDAPTYDGPWSVHDLTGGPSR